MKSKSASFLTELTAILTLAAQLPYEFGNISVVLPPELKKWVTVAGIIGTVGLSLLKLYLKTKEEKQLE